MVGDIQEYFRRFKELYSEDLLEFFRKEDNMTTECRQKIINMLDEVKEDVMKVFDFGAQKHPDSGTTPNFLMKDGNCCGLKNRGSSVLRHSARTFMNPGLKDEESDLSELLHLMASASILYIRHKRNIVHPDDES